MGVVLAVLLCPEKLFKKLAKRMAGHTLYILDKPTTRLHLPDLCTLF